VLPSVQIKWLRAIRGLRPLRVISRLSGMKIVVGSLLKSLPSIINVVLVCLLFWILFGILGVQFFGGKFSQCSDPTILVRSECVGTYVDPDTNIEAALRWAPPRGTRSFDNIFAAMLTLFELSSTENWPQIMWQGVDAVSDEHAPVRDHNKWASLYFISFVIVGSFFAVNLFVGVVIDYFGIMKDRHDGSALLTQTQRDWVELQKLMVRYKPVRRAKPPKAKWRKSIFKFATGVILEYTIMVMIILNIICTLFIYLFIYFF
jgi:hypothetical protein